MAAHIVRFGRFLARVCLLPTRRADRTLRPQATAAPPKLPVTPSRLRPYSTDEISSARRPAGYGMGRDNPLTKALFWHPKGGSGGHEWWGTLPPERVSHLLPHTFEVRSSELSVGNVDAQRRCLSHTVSGPRARPRSVSVTRYPALMCAGAHTPHLRARRRPRRRRRSAVIRKAPRHRRGVPRVSQGGGRPRRR